MEESPLADTSIPPPTAFSVVVFSQAFKFNLAHFVAYRGFRERLHGHNYSLSIELMGSRISSDGYVMDFGDVKAVCKVRKRMIHVPVRRETTTCEP